MKGINIRDKRERENGFTFMEVIIVLAIMALLSGAVGFQVIKSLEKARYTAANGQIDSFMLAMDAFYLDMGRYPSDDEGLDVLFKRPDGEDKAKWAGPYLVKSVPKDPWGNKYVYKASGKSIERGEIISYGADGKLGGEGSDRDISSLENDE